MQNPPVIFEVSLAESSDLRVDSKHTLISGMQLWVLAPFSPVRPSKMSCSEKNKCSKKSSSSSSILQGWLQKIAPQSKDLVYRGSQIRQTILLPGDTLYIPHNWFGIRVELEDSVHFRDLELSDECIEESAVRMAHTEINMFKKFLYSRDEKKREQRRFDGVMKQVATAKAKLKNKAKK